MVTLERLRKFLNLLDDSICTKLVITDRALEVLELLTAKSLKAELRPVRDSDLVVTCEWRPV